MAKRFQALFSQPSSFTLYVTTSPNRSYARLQSIPHGVFGHASSAQFMLTSSGFPSVLRIAGHAACTREPERRHRLVIVGSNGIR